MNLYMTLERAKLVIGVAGTTYDQMLLGYLEAASRRCDDVCGRHFFTWSGSRKFGGKNDAGRLWLGDVLSISSFGVDTEGDETFDGETWTEGTDFVLGPENAWPKVFARPHRNGTKAFADVDPYVQVTGVFGYGDGLSADPWSATSVTGTVADGTGTALTLSVSGGLETGVTIKIGSEQLYVSAVSGTTATVVRGVNGTVAAAHSGAAISLAKYPARLVQTLEAMVVEAWNKRRAYGVQQQSLASFSQQFYACIKDEAWERLLGPLVWSPIG